MLPEKNQTALQQYYKLKRFCNPPALCETQAAQPTQAVTVPKITRYLRKDATWQLYKIFDNFARIFNTYHAQYCHNARSGRQNIKKIA